MISSLRLVKDKVVDSAYSISDELRTQISLNTHGLSNSEIAEYCLKLTLKELEFSKQNDISNGGANCVGYAQFFKSVCNHAYTVNGREVTVEHVRGYVSCFGVNLCKVAKAIVPAKFKGFVKDHDFVEVDFGDYQCYLDPSLSDVFGITISCRIK